MEIILLEFLQTVCEGRGDIHPRMVLSRPYPLIGKVVDYEVMSKECRECMLWKDKEGTDEFMEWWEGHQANCNANFEGSSGAMDAAGVLSIYQRSVENYGLQYVEFFGDGDSKSYKVLVDEAVYGNIA